MVGVALYFIQNGESGKNNSSEIIFVILSYMENTNTFGCNPQPLLTIAIPTYNRAEYLDICLRRIGEEIADLSEDLCKLVNVYVSNNGSSDNTSDVICKYQTGILPRFEVVNNVANIGPDRNIMQCYSSAKTPYVWVFGDDDVILSGGLRKVLNVLVKKKDIDILYVSGYSYSNSYLDEPVKGRGNSGVVEYIDPLDFVKRTHIMLTFITALIVRSGVCLIPFDELVDGSNLSQMSWVLALIRDGKKFAILEDRIYAAKIANSGGYGAVKVFGSNLCHIANVILVKQPKLVGAIKNGTIVMWFPTYIMSLRGGMDVGFSRENIAVDLKKVYGGNWRYYVFLAPLISLPNFIVPVYYIVVRLIRKLLRPILI